MNTFLPYKDFNKIAKVLDDKRLFKQVVESMQVIDIITTGLKKDGTPYPKSMLHHKIINPWRDYIPCLKFYHDVLLEEVYNRKKWKTTMLFYGPSKDPIIYPKWLTNKVCEMYQSHLLCKNSIYYKFNVDPTIPFDWNLIK